MGTVEFRQSRYINLLEKNNHEFTEDQYKQQIKAHAFTLEKYLSRFHIWAKKFYENQPIKKAKEYEWVKKFYTKRPTIKDIFNIFENNDLKHDFMNYFMLKTHMSYDLKSKPNPTNIDKQQNAYASHYLRRSITITENDNQNKFAEFVYLILAEYIILHNYMWASGFKVKNVKSIDKWLKNI